MANPIILVVTIAIIACSTIAEAFIGPPGIPGVTWGAGTKLCFGFNGLSSQDEETTNEEDREEDISQWFVSNDYSGHGRTVFR